MQTFSIQCPQPNSRSNKTDHLSWASWLYSSDSGVIQYMQINKCNSSHICVQVKKWYRCLNKHRKCHWQNLTAIHDKTMDRLDGWDIYLHNKGYRRQI